MLSCKAQEVNPHYTGNLMGGMEDLIPPSLFAILFYV